MQYSVFGALCSRIFLQSDGQNIMEARNSLLGAIHCYPTDLSLRRQLMLLYLNSLPASKRGSILRLCQSDVDIEDLMSIFSLLAGDMKRALAQAQAVVHRNPGKILQLVSRHIFSETNFD